MAAIDFPNREAVRNDWKSSLTHWTRPANNETVRADCAGSNLNRRDVREMYNEEDFRVQI